MNETKTDNKFTSKELTTAANAIQLQLIKYITACYYEGDPKRAIENGISNVLLPAVKNWFIINNAKERNGSITELEANKYPVLRINDTYTLCGYIAASASSYSILKEYGLFYNDETLVKEEEENRLANMIEDLTQNKLNCKQFSEKYGIHVSDNNLDELINTIIENYDIKSLTHIGFNKADDPLILNSLIQNQNEDNEYTNEMAIYKFLNDNPTQYDSYYKDGTLYVNNNKINLEESYLEMTFNKEDASLKSITIFLWLADNLPKPPAYCPYIVPPKGYSISGIDVISQEKRVDFGNKLYFESKEIRRLYEETPKLLPQYVIPPKQWDFTEKKPEKKPEEIAEENAREAAESEAAEAEENAREAAEAEAAEAEENAREAAEALKNKKSTDIEMEDNKTLQQVFNEYEEPRKFLEKYNEKTATMEESLEYQKILSKIKKYYQKFR